MPKLTEKSIQAARQWYVDNAQACIDDVVQGRVHVEDKQGYYAWCRRQADEALAGMYDRTFAFQQRAYAIQTDECIALLSKR